MRKVLHQGIFSPSPPLYHTHIQPARLSTDSVPQWLLGRVCVSVCVCAHTCACDTGSRHSLPCTLPSQLSQILLPFLSITSPPLFLSTVILSPLNSKPPSHGTSETLSDGHQLYVRGIFPHETGRPPKAGTVRPCTACPAVRSSRSEDTGLGVGSHARERGL